MKDRLPTQVVNGAIRMEQLDENGNHIGYIYLKRADEPTEEGTPYNVENVLTDETAEKLGLDATNNPAPNDAFAKIAEAIANPNIVVSQDEKLFTQGGIYLDLGNAKIAYGSYVGNGKYGASNKITIFPGFNPLLAIVTPKSVYDTVSVRLVAARGTTYARATDGWGTNMVWTDTDVSWYNADSTYGARYGYNLNGTEYFWVVIGVNN